MKPIEAKSAVPFSAKATLPVDNARSNEKKAVTDAAEQFESMLVLQMLRTMQTSLENQSLFGEGQAAQTYGSLGEWELARTIAKSGDFGLKKELLSEIEKLENRNGIQSK